MSFVLGPRGLGSFSFVRLGMEAWCSSWLGQHEDFHPTGPPSFSDHYCNVLILGLDGLVF